MKTKRQFVKEIAELIKHYDEYKNLFDEIDRDIERLKRKKKTANMLGNARKH